MARLPIVLLHGYGSNATALERWREVLIEHGYDATAIHLGEYISLSNEITIKDLAEAFDRALRVRAGLDADEEFDAIVHSTGGLVIREWLVTYGSRRRRLKRLIGLAPATFGSPLAHKGRSWLGAVFRGERELGPDFMEAGQLVLSGLELGSSYSWQLAHRDLLADPPVYDESDESPFPFVFIGTGHYGLLRQVFAAEPGADGTVRWAAAGFNTRKIVIDLTREPGADTGGTVAVAPWNNIDVPLVLLEHVNHGTIVSKPPDALVAMVMQALEVSDHDAYRAWSREHSSLSPERLAKVDAGRWQQFVVHAIDERGDPVPDYYLEVGSRRDGRFELLEHFALDVHAFTDDPSYRCFHVDLDKLDPEQRPALALRLTARSGTELVAYHGANSETFTRTGEPEPGGKWDASIDLTSHLSDTGVRFFFAYTTTLVEVRLNREPMPPTGVSGLLQFTADE
ncbi:MAG: hypothetical protein M3296_11160 [Actinomycetota bacterium]|nr:hypothetical protein [Actinomycetota bacterium]